MILSSRLHGRSPTMRRFFAICFCLTPLFVFAATPSLQTIRFGGSDQDALAGMVMDGDGNYYLAGTTASLDLPANGFQPHPGGAPLYRLRGSRAEPLYPP